MEYTTERDASGRAALRVGLMQVKGLRVEKIVAIVREREEHGRFVSLADFLARVPVERDEIEALIKCGAMDEVCGMTRAAMLWEWNLLQKESGEWRVTSGEREWKVEEVKETELVAPFRGAQDEKPESSAAKAGWESTAHGTAEVVPSRSSHSVEEETACLYDKGAGRRRALEKQEGGVKLPLQKDTAGVLFAEMEQEGTIGLALREIEAPDYTREQKLRYEREILEVCVSGHPLDFLPRSNETWSDELPGLRGKRVTLCGWVVTYRHVGTKNYRNMMFVTLEDQHGLFEVILFPDAYDKYGGLVYETRAMRVTGMVMDGEHINGEKMERLDEN